MCEHTLEAVGQDELADGAPQRYRCKHCGQTFVEAWVWTAEAVKADTVAATASAMLWDFHERAIEKYGAMVASALAPDGDTPSPHDALPDDGHAHEWNLGKCDLCGTSLYVGE